MNSLSTQRPVPGVPAPHAQQDDHHPLGVVSHEQREDALEAILSSQAESILDELRAIGPRLTVVRGNCDSNFDWPLVIDLIRTGLKFRLQHIPPDRPPDDVDILLHGHTHVPRHEKRGSVLFLNPGCVTRANQGAPPSVAWLEIAQGKIDWKLLLLR